MQETSPHTCEVYDVRFIVEATRWFGAEYALPLEPRQRGFPSEGLEGKRNRRFQDRA
jgi:hypothetical protein